MNFFQNRRFGKKEKKRRICFKGGGSRLPLEIEQCHCSTRTRDFVKTAHDKISKHDSSHQKNQEEVDSNDEKVFDRIVEVFDGEPIK